MAGALFAAALLVFLVNEARVEWLSRRSSSAPAAATASNFDRGSKITLVIAFTVGVLGACGAPVLFPALSFDQSSVGARGIFGVGLVLILVATAGRVWAVHTLGRWFTTEVRTDAAQPVIEHGPYRWVRHPSYTALMACLAGIGLVLGNLASLGIMVIVPMIGFAFRIRVEEQALFAQLGEPYQRYAQTHRRLLPGIW